jgi:beta-glucanase (GH16 family)
MKWRAKGDQGTEKMSAGLKSVIAIAATMALLCATRSAVAQIPDVPGWELTWHDEFDGNAIDTDKWVPLDRQDSHNNEKQYYKPEQVAVVDGNLRITATNQPIANKQYRSGLITSKNLFGPGRYEARIDLPTSQGMWPAFWMNANQTQWPTAGEIDILENRGSQPDLVSSAYHWQVDPNAPCCGQHQYTFKEYIDDDQPVDFHSGFHTYAVEWDPNVLRFYVDGNLYHVVGETPNRPIFEVAKNIILNLAVGGDFGGDPNTSSVFPQTMLVDYVRVWQRQTGVQGDYNNDGVIDATDYTVWRNSEGESGIGLPADGSGNGTVGPEDYQIWKSNYGEEVPAAGSGGQAAPVVPEPTSAVPTSVGMMLLYARRAWFAFETGRVA